ncbi:MAG: ABC transporter substrate-binding protein, partial [Desulfonatronovibrio sp.]
FDTVEDEPHSYDQAVEKAKSAEATVLMMFGYLNSSILMRKAISIADWRPDAYYATIGPVNNEYQDVLKDLAENSFSTSIWKYHSSLIYSGVHRFNADFIKTYNEDPSYHAAAAYAAGQLMSQALERTGSVNYKELRDILEKMESFSILGRYGVNYRGQQIRHVAFITQWQQGNLEIVWPPNLSTSSPRIEYGPR